MENWPDALPNISLGLQYSKLNGAYRKEMTSGRVRQERLYTISKGETSIRFGVDSYQLDILRAWVSFKLNNGADWFNISLPINGQWKLETVRFKNSTYSIQANGTNYWNVSATLETFESVLMTEQELTALVDNVEWPVDALAKPLIDSYTVNPVISNLRSNIEGFTVQRARFSNTHGRVVLSWILTHKQFQIFRAFLFYKLANGIARRWMPLPFGSNYIDHQIQFSNGAYSATLNDGGQDWTVRATLDVYDVQTISEQELNNILDITENLEAIEAAANRLYYLMNTTLPTYNL